MKYVELTVRDGVIVENFVKEIPQDSLTSDCWMIQFKGLSACKSCEFKNTPHCGGGETLKKMKNIKK